MEHLFSPCTRLIDLFENEDLLGDIDGYGFMEEFEDVRELNLDLSTEELLSAERGFTYADLYAMLESGEKVAWLTPRATIMRPDGISEGYVNILADGYYRFGFTADDKQVVVVARSSEHLLEICDAVLRLLAVSVIHSVVLDKVGTPYSIVINAPTLAHLMEQCQSLKVLELSNQEMDENHCRVLGAYSRPDLDIELIRCKFTPDGANALVEVLGRNQGPTELYHCEIDNAVLADGLRGNSRLKSFGKDFSDSRSSNREVLSIANALQENQGLIKLDLKCRNSNMNDETWGAVCDSIKTHPTLEVLHLYVGPPRAPDVITSRIQALVDMIKVNNSISTIDVHHSYWEHEMYQGSVIPYLKTNRLRPRLLAIQKTRPIAYRAKVLGRALLAVRTDPNRFWMLLSGNAEVTFPSSTTTTTPTANLPTPATASAIGATGGATNPVATSLPAANIAARTFSQKRKRCP
jgi:hypothetical protein